MMLSLRFQTPQVAAALVHAADPCLGLVSTLRYPPALRIQQAAEAEVYWMAIAGCYSMLAGCFMMCSYTCKGSGEAGDYAATAEGGYAYAHLEGKGGDQARGRRQITDP